MERFIVREPRTGAEYPQGNQLISFSTNAVVGSNMIPPETMYFSGPFASEFPNEQHNIGVQHNMTAHQNMGAQHNMDAQQNMIIQRNMGANQNIGVQHNMGANQNMGAQHNMDAQQNMGIQRNIGANQNMGVQHNIGAKQNMGAQHNMDAQQNMSVQGNMGANQNMGVQHSMGAKQNMGAQHNMDAQQNMGVQRNISANQNMGVQHNMIANQNMGVHQNISGQNYLNAQRNLNAQHNMETPNNMSIQRNINSQMPQRFGQNSIAGQMSGIDPRYLAGYADNSAQFIVTGQQIQRNATPINRSFGTDYQNRSFSGIDRNKQKNFAPQFAIDSPRLDAMPKPRPQPMVARNTNKENVQQNSSVPLLKKSNELDLAKGDIQNQIVTRADKLKALSKSGPRAFSGPVEKVLKWHKSLQDIGLLIFYEIVAKCVSVRPGELGSKVLVVRDDSGPAMQVVYYEIDFLLPELKLPCTVRVVGRMMSGTCRLQAFNVRPATGDDVATLPRRAAVATHHVAKLCKEYGSNAH